MDHPNVEGVDFAAASITASGGTVSNITANGTGVAQIDTVTLTGTSGTANVLCDAVTKLATFFNSLTETAAGFVAMYAADYLPGGVVVTSSGANIILTSNVPGTAFAGGTTINNVANLWKGSIKIEGNQIYENAENSDTSGYITLNFVGYNGGVTKYRRFIVGDGKGHVLMNIGGDAAGGWANFLARSINFLNIPTSNAGLGGGYIYRDGAGANAILKIV